MKERKSFAKRFIAACATVAIMVGTISTGVFAAAPQGDSSSFIGYKVSSRGFNVYGVSENGGQIKTTYSDKGYYTNLTCTDLNVAQGTNASLRYGENLELKYQGTTIATYNINAQLDASGKAVVLTYSVTNVSDTAREFKIGSSSDCQIGTDDSANVRDYANSGLTMTNRSTGAKFFLLPGNEPFTTRWSGHYSGNASNIYSNSSSHNYSGDSGLAWSWTLNIPANTTVTRTCTIAVGVDLVSNNITFDANGGEGTMNGTSMVAGVAGTLPANTFTRERYDFLGWATTADATEAEYADRSTITITEDTTLYAVWQIHKEDPTYTAPEANQLTYNAQAQALVTPGSTEDGTIYYSLSNDETAEFTTTVPTATASGDYTVYYYVAGDDFHFDTDVQSIPVTIAPLYVNVTFDGVATTANAELPLARPEDPTQDGRVFAGWYTDTACTNPYSFEGPVGINDINLYSGWTTIAYRITNVENSEYQIGSDATVVITAERNVDEATTFAHFTGVNVDGQVLDTSNYTAESGSVIVTLNNAYLDTLAAGSHTIELTFDDATAVSATITVVEAPAETEEPSETTEPEETTDVSDVEETTVVTEETTVATEETAATTEATFPAVETLPSTAPTAAPTTAAPTTAATEATSASVLGVQREVEETTTAASESSTESTTAAATPTPTAAPSGVANTGEASSSNNIFGILLALAGVGIASCFVAKVRKENI